MYLPKRKTQKREADAAMKKEAHAMTRNYNVSGEKRKELVKKVAEFTGEKEKYLGIPTYSYQSGPFNIGRNGEISWEPEAGETAKKLIFWLKIAGFTAEGEEAQTEPEQSGQAAEMEQSEPVLETVGQDATAEETPAEETMEEVVEEDTEDSSDASEENDSSDLADASAETKNPDTGTEPETEDSEPDSEPEIENAADTGEEKEQVTEPDAETEPDDATPDKEDGSVTDVDEVSEEDATAEPDTLSISIPDDLTDSQRENLVKLVRSKETLLKHAFKTDSVEIHMEDGKLIFPWFTASDSDHTNAYILFLTKLAAFAKEAKRVTAADHPVENEKYALRTWLLRLDMIGPEYKGCRKVLLENLTGNGAFRDGHKKSSEKNTEEASE